MRQPVAAVAADLARACHPLPTVAVTSFAAALTAAAGGRRRQVARVAAAVLSGHLALGWANDALDADLDAAAGRTSGPGAKPVAAGRLPRAGVAACAVAAAATAVPLSLAAGRRAGGLHLAALAAGLAYDLGLKGTPASPLPYAAFFGTLPAVTATAAGRAPVPALCVAAATLGIGAHFANTLKDADTDRQVGVRGLPQLLGPNASRALAAVLVAGADGVVLLAGRTRRGGQAVTPLPAAARALLVASAALGVGGAARGGPAAFRAVVAAAGLAVGGVVVGARSLHATPR